MLAAGSEIGQAKVLFLEPDLHTAQAAAYAAVECIQFDGAHFRATTEESDALGCNPGAKAERRSFRRAAPMGQPAGGAVLRL